MTIQFDDKGKFFTDIISKAPIPATIQTLTHRIQGNIFVRQGERLIDELVAVGQFIAVTNAVVYTTRGEPLYRSEFMTINRDQIVWIVPHEGEKSSSDSGGPS